MVVERSPIGFLTNPFVICAVVVGTALLVWLKLIRKGKKPQKKYTPEVSTNARIWNTVILFTSIIVIHCNKINGFAARRRNHCKMETSATKDSTYEFSATQ
jgi:heme/copper-type cytochrome/quinol oxidase subunit 2